MSEVERTIVSSELVICRALVIFACAVLIGGSPGCAIKRAGVMSAHQAGPAAGSASLVDVGPPEVVLSAKERPYSWPDGTMGVLEDGLQYRFFAASAGFPMATIGTLQNPIEGGGRDLKIDGLKKPYDYVAGGPIYRDNRTGCLLMFYHAEFYTFPPGYLPFYSEIGLARSLDEGKTWNDMGAILAPHIKIHAPYFQAEKRSWDIGWGGYVIVGDYFFVYFADLLDEGQQYNRVNHAVARARIDDVMRAASEQGIASTWAKYHEGLWMEPGLGGKSSPLFEQVSESFLILGDVSYNSYLKKYVAIVIGEPWPNTDLYWIESDDGLRWTNYHKIVGDPGHQFYVTIVDSGAYLRQSGEEFYIYYVDSPDFAQTGNRNKDGRLVRRLITVR